MDESGSYRHADDPGEPTTGKPRLSVTDLEANILAALVAGRDVLEIGTGLGVSTRAMASKALSVTTVDVDPWVHENVWPTLPDNVARWNGAAIAGRFDVVFIDGDHSTEAVIADLATARIYVRPGGMIIAHDVNYDTVRAGLDGDWHFVPTTHGLGLCWA